jgi:hypothetical protein
MKGRGRRDTSALGWDGTGWNVPSTPGAFSFSPNPRVVTPTALGEASLSGRPRRRSRASRPGRAASHYLRTIEQEAPRSRGCLCPKSAVGAVPPRLLVLCLLLRGSWLTVEGGRHGAAGVPHRRGERAALAGSVSVGCWRAHSQLSPPRRQISEFSGGCGGLAPPARRLVLVQTSCVVQHLRRGCSRRRSGSRRAPGERAVDYSFAPGAVTSAADRVAASRLKRASVSGGCFTDNAKRERPVSRGAWGESGRAT